MSITTAIAKHLEAAVRPAALPVARKELAAAASKELAAPVAKDVLVRAVKRDAVTEAERAAFRLRGVGEKRFEQLLASGRTGEELARLRVFADAHATSQGGKYLPLAARGATAQEAEALIGRTIARDFGLVAGAEVPTTTLLSLVRDLGTEAPRDAKAIVETANAAFRRGVTDYYAVNALATERLLRDIGVDAGKLGASDAALKAALPGLAPDVARAEQLRMLRDRLRVLPEAQRGEAIAALRRSKADLVGFEAVLGAANDRAAVGLLGGNRALAEGLLAGLPPQQKANLVSDLANLTPEARRAAFSGLTGTAAQQQAQAVDRLATLAESRYGVKVHRAAGQVPYGGADAAVKDWSVQAAAELVIGLEKLSGGRKLEPMQGATFFHLAGNEAAMPAGEATLGTLYRPGAGRYRPGQSGLTGKEFRGMGYRTEVNGREYVALYDTALKLDNSNRVAGVSRGVGTIVHESAHVVQLGGGDAERGVLTEWSRISNWREADRSLADGVDRAGRGYYKDPSVRVGDRAEVVSQYGATDPVEDFAEYARVFVLDPSSALAVSPEKFVSTNRSFEGLFSKAQLDNLAAIAGLKPERIAKALLRLGA